MDHSKECNGKIFKLMNSFFMNNCTCDQSEVGYCSLIAAIVCVTPLRIFHYQKYLILQNIEFFQFEVAEREYKRKRTGEIKLTKRTERVPEEASIIDLVEDFTLVRKEYLVHHY